MAELGTLKFSVSRCCCGCRRCCQWHLPGYLVDFGVGGWTNVRCNNCADIRGLYVLDVFVDEENCRHSIDLTQAGLCTRPDFPFPIVPVFLLTVTVTDDCAIEVFLMFGITNIVSTVNYRLENPSCEGPWTLSKVGTDFHGSEPGIGSVCAGTMPPQIVVAKI